MFKRVLLISVFWSLSIVLFGQTKNLTPPKELNQKKAEKRVSFLAGKCWHLRAKKPDSALWYGKKAMALAEQYKIIKSIPNLDNSIGVIYINYLYDSKSAVPYFHQAMELSLQNNDSVQLGYAYNNLGDAFMLTGNTDLAYEYAENSLSIFEALKNSEGIAYGYINLALVYRSEKKYDLALKYFDKAKDIREKLGQKTSLVSNLYNIAITYQKQGNLKKAKEYYEESYKLQIAIDNKLYAAYCLNGIAKNYYLQNQFDKSYDYFMRAVQLNKENKHQYGLIDNYIGLALVYAQQHKRKEGEDVLNKALIISKELAQTAKILQVSEAYAKFYQILNDYKQATQRLNKFLVLYDSIYSIQRREIFSEIQNSFLVRHSLNDAEIELEKRELERRYLLLILAVILIIVMAIIWRTRLRSRVNRQLNILNQTKDKLFSVISHDLKGPYNSLLGFSELLIEDLNEKNYEDANKYAGIIHNSAEDNLKLLTNLLNWTQSQTGRIKFNPMNFSLEQMFVDLGELFKIDLDKNAITIQFKNEIKHEVYGDPNILRIVLRNLISNALKYTDQGGLIQVIASQTSSQTIIQVVDNGIGISDIALKNIFDKTKLIDSRLGLRKEKGTGLGIYICKELIHIHKGQLSAESKLGEGSVFKIEFPIKHA